MTVPVSDLQAVAPSAIIELFVLELNTLQHGTNEVYRFHAGTSLNASGELVWNGNSYMRFPIEAEGFEYSGNGQLPRPKIRISNVLGTITALLLTLPEGLEGAKVTRIRTLARYLDAVNFPGSINPYGTPDPTAEFPQEIYYVDRKTTENREVIEFELAAAFDLQNVRAPKRQCIANICQWVYRSTECGYTAAAYWTENDVPTFNAAEDVCGKRLSSCELRFKSFTRIGSVTSGSNQLTITNPVTTAVGTPIFGHGIPSSTTVSSISTSGLIITLSQNASASSTATHTGTIQSNRTQLVVSSATGLAIGMTVSGPNIPSGTTISGISGTTLTLSQLADETFSLNSTRQGRIGNVAETTYGTVSPISNRLTITTSGLTLNMRVMGLLLPTNYSTYITGVYADYVTLSYSVEATYQLANYSFYTLASYTSQTYTFDSDRTYTFRDPANDALPFGSFPGIGTYFS